MSPISFVPAAGAAPASRRILAHARTETRLLLRNGEQLLLALVIPVGILLAGRVIGGRFGEPATLSPSVLALAVWSSAFTSVAIATGFERRYGVLERLAPTPLGRTGLLAGKAISVAAVVLGQLLILSMVAVVLGWRPEVSVVPTMIAVVAVLLSIGVFCCLALLIAGTLRAEITLALANLIYVIFVICGALVIPVARYPEALQPVVRLLPTAAIAESLRDWSVGVTAGWPLIVLACWLLIAGLAARKAFRWTS